MFQAWRWFPILWLLAVLCLLFVAPPAFAQRDKMSLGESFGATVIRAQPAPAGASATAIPQPRGDALAPKEDLQIKAVPRPPLPSPYDKRRTGQ
jgi:hypothetical protein